MSKIETRSFLSSKLRYKSWPNSEICNSSYGDETKNIEIAKNKRNHILSLKIRSWSDNTRNLMEKNKRILKLR